MTEIRVGAEVTLVGKVLEITDFPSEYNNRVRISNGLVLWLPDNAFDSVKNPQHSEPESGYAVVDGRIAWRSGAHGAWETDCSAYRDWAHLLELEYPETVVELVRKDAA